MIDPLWVQAFVLTVAVEVPVVVMGTAKGGRRRAACVAACTQLATHPLAWLAFHDGLLGWWGVEAAVVAAEAFVYAIAGRGAVAALGVSLLANACSAACGVAVFGP